MIFANLCWPRNFISSNEHRYNLTLYTRNPIHSSTKRRRNKNKMERKTLCFSCCVCKFIYYSLNRRFVVFAIEWTEWVWQWFNFCEYFIILLIASSSRGAFALFIAVDWLFVRIATICTIVDRFRLDLYYTFNNRFTCFQHVFIVGRPIFWQCHQQDWSFRTFEMLHTQFDFFAAQNNCIGTLSGISKNVWQVKGCIGWEFSLDWLARKEKKTNT